MGGGKIDGIFTGFDVPFPPRGDDLELRSQCLDAQFKTNLIVALTCSTMADGIGIFLQGHFNKMLCNDRTGNGRSQEIFLFINGAGFDHGPSIIAKEFIPQIKNISLGSPAL